MASTKYTYSVSGDFPNQAVDLDRLTAEVAATDIVTALDYINVADDDCDIWFKDELSSGDETLLDGVVAAHSGQVLYYPSKVDFEDSLKDASGVPIFMQQPNTPGYRLCRRDFKILTATMGDGDIDAIWEDLRMNPTTHKEESWNEVSVNGVYKLDGQDLVSCVDEADANANAVQTEIDIDFKKQSDATATDIDIIAGYVWVPETLPGDPWAYRFYSVMAPDFSALNMHVSFFDGYLYPFRGGWTMCSNAAAMNVQPSPPGAGTLRLYFLYPAGTQLTFLFSLKSYRPEGTF